jgi:isoquinoline 1-oxidoreductase subunit beta
MKTKTSLPALSRREFVATSTALVIGFVFAPSARRLFAAEGPPKAAPLQPNAFLRIAEDDSVTVLLAHSEMGQGVWTTLPMFVAEELDCDWSKLRVEHAPPGSAYRHTMYGMQMTGGSTSSWSEFDRYRQVGAMARDMLIRAAAAQWKVAPARCTTEAGFVVYGDKRLSYGSLAAKASRLSPPLTVKLKEAKDWKIIGKPTKRLDSIPKVTGAAQFGIDVHEPGMMTAVLTRAPVFGGKVKSFDATRAKAIPGVRNVVQVPSGVAVIAENFWAAKRGRDALSVDWDLGEGASLNTEKLFDEYRRLSRTTGAKVTAAGNIDEPVTTPAALEAEYELPYLAHATMEPLNCAVKLTEGACEIWLGTQFQELDQQAAAEVAGLKPEQVTLHTTFLGGGFGRRATGTAHVVREAVAIAKAANVPVKVVWTREDDMRGGYYRPQWFHHLKVHTGVDGLPLRWDHTVVGQSILHNTPFEPMLVKDGVDATSAEGASDSPYLAEIPTHRVQLHSPVSPVPTLWWRSVGHSHTAFVMESAIDELAHAAKQDPLAYRQRLLAKHPRHLGALNLAAEKAGWGTPLPAGRARGIAVHESFGSWVAQVAEVSLEGSRLRVHRVTCAIDCGVCFNPAGVAAQMESGIVYGLSAALYGRITMKDGRVEQSNFHDYPVLRLDEMPRIEVHVVPSTEKSGGAGEPGTPPIAPAVANALFALNGRRLRRLPFDVATVS